ncbi:hypothetical protein [Hyphomonas atlantica]|uniref:hypothetical protein n=1 Tax=Hyphomonas atlantica TaxID=1280948 RepID=UPI0019D7148E|nr:hypothetical protein [Hyphomonas atlantica]
MVDVKAELLVDLGLNESTPTLLSNSVDIDESLISLEAADFLQNTDLLKAPPNADDLGELLVSTYELSIEAAAKLKIPVIGSVSGGAARRVVVYEWTRFKEIEDDGGGFDRWGYAIRFCVTVSKINADTSIALPFIAAEAQLGRLEASWTMQVRGLQGPKIDGAVLPPESLDVETFFLARQSLTDVVAALSDSKTKITPVYLLRKNPPTDADEYSIITKKTFIVAALANERNSNWVFHKLGGSSNSNISELIEQVYADFEAEMGQRPNSVAVAKAKRALDGIQLRNV